jgi:hypothetical protein
MSGSSLFISNVIGMVKTMEGYCLKDKKKVEMKDPQPITMKNGKPATVGTCPICGTKIYRIGKSS